MPKRNFNHLSLALALVLAISSTVLSQTSARGIALFDKGDFAGAVETLKSSGNFVDLNYLGQAYEKQGKTREARDAYGRSFRAGYEALAPDIVVRADFEKDRPAPVQKLSDFLTANKTEILIAALSARQAFAMKAPEMKEPEWAIRAKLFSEMGAILAPGAMVYSARELDKPAKRLTMPRPRYTNEARSSRTSGSVRLLLLIGTDGKVKAILPTKPLPNGLTESAFLSAAESTFTPAERAGSPVAVFSSLHYSFNVR
jgi:hypothetical protein